MSLSFLNFSSRKRLPIIRSVEAAECGLACIAMVGCYHGHDIDLNTLRQRFALSLQGTTLRHLMQLADQLTLAPRALRVEIESLSKVQLPAILHWDFNHFVVLKEVRGNSATIHDPAKGVQRITLDAVSAHFTGVVLELTPAEGFVRTEARSPIRLSHLWSRITGLQKAITQVLLLSAAYQIVTFALPFHIQLVVDEVVARGDRNLLVVLALGFGALTLLHAGLEALRNWVLHLLGSAMSFQVVGNIVRHLLRLPTSFFEKRHIGDILSRVESTTAIQDALTRGMVSAIVDGVMAILAAVILFFYSPMLAGIVVLSLLIVLGLGVAFYPATRARSEEQLIASAYEQSQLMETVRAISTIKLLGGETERESRWRNRYAAVINAGLNVGKLEISLHFLQMAVIGVQTILVIYLGARLVIDAAGFSIGMLMAFLSFRQTFTDRTLSLISEIIRFRLLRLHLERLSDIVTASPEVVAHSAAPALNFLGGMEVSNVSFRYGASSPLILHGVSLSIMPGDFIAISGRSGGGKTTLAKLLLGLNTPEAGEILLDGRRASPDVWRVWRGQIGVVAQDDRLLSGSIADNIAFFDPGMDMQRVMGAAAAAFVHDEIMHMPMQYQSLVGDMGSALSGGQRQRILLARALYRQPKLLLLDEGTANLDETTEQQIADVIAALPITRIVIAHRPALIARAKRHFIVEGGSLIEHDGNGNFGVPQAAEPADQS